MKLKNIFAVLFTSAFLVNALFAEITLDVDTEISESDFNNSFNNNRIWYVQFQPGGNNNTAHEVEISDVFGERTDLELSSESFWTNSTNNSFTVSIDDANNLSASVNSEVFAPADAQILDPFNEIWIGVTLSTSDDIDSIAINNHAYDSQSLSPEISLTESDGTTKWSGFKFHDNESTHNIAEFDVSGSISLSFWPEEEPTSVGGGEDWTYTIFGTHNSSVPEPSTYAFFLGAIALIVVFFKKKRP